MIIAIGRFFHRNDFRASVLSSDTLRLRRN